MMPTLKNDSGYTLAMHWITHVHTDPPEWMRHDPNMRSGNGSTLQDLWQNIGKTELPAWMKCVLG